MALRIMNVIFSLSKKLWIEKYPYKRFNHLSTTSTSIWPSNIGISKLICTLKGAVPLLEVDASLVGSRQRICANPSTTANKRRIYLKRRCQPIQGIDQLWYSYILRSYRCRYCRQMVEFARRVFFFHNFSNREKITFSLLKAVPHVKYWWENLCEKKETKEPSLFIVTLTSDSFKDVIKE